MTALVIFVVSYMGIAMGRIPGLAVDRVGIAILGAIAMVASGAISPQEAVRSIEGRLSFKAFFFWAYIPSFLSLSAGFATIAMYYRKDLIIKKIKAVNENDMDRPQFDRWQTIKGIMAVVALVDWHLITLFCALFIIIHGISLAHLPERVLEFLSQKGFELTQPAFLTSVSVVLSNLKNETCQLPHEMPGLFNGTRRQASHQPGGAAQKFCHKGQKTVIGLVDEKVQRFFL